MTRMNLSSHRAELILSLILGLTAHEVHGSEKYEFSQIHMGAKFSIVLYTSDSDKARMAADSAFRRIAQLDQIMSDYREDSELMIFCRGTSNPPRKLSADLWKVLKHSQELSQLSNGAFDVTIGTAVRLWRRARRQRALPSPQRLRQARALVGYKMLTLNEQDHTARLTMPGVFLDLGGIAKGYAADAALTVLNDHGVSRALMAAGGDIRLGAAPPGKKGWSVAIRALAKGDDNPPTLVLSDCAVSTSGDAEQYVEIDGVRYSHIVDPRTGLGLKGQRGVTVIANRGIVSDSLATSICVMGRDEGFGLLQHYDGAAARFVEKKKGRVSCYYSSSWRYDR